MPTTNRRSRTLFTAGNLPRPVEARTARPITRKALRRQWAALAAPRA